MCVFAVAVFHVDISQYAEWNTSGMICRGHVISAQIAHFKDCREKSQEVSLTDTN